VRKMKKIKVKFVDCPFVEENCLKILEKNYEVEISDTPDYAFFDYTNLKKCVDYDCIRILYIGENARPDFNLFDYAIGFDDIKFDNRYCHIPLYAMPNVANQILKPALLKHEKVPSSSELAMKKFCCFVVSNGANANSVRQRFFEKLNEYQHVDSAGKFLNNMQDGWCVGPEDTREFVSNYKFQICFENSSCKGYTTEKLIGAWAAGVVPIYWGDPSVTEVFNPEAFVWVKDTTEEELDKAFQQVKYLNENEKAYTNMLAQPILKDMGNPPEYFAKDYLERYLLEIIDLPLDKALERTNAKDGWGAFYETDYLRHREMDQSKLISLIYRIRRRLKK